MSAASRQSRFSKGATLAVAALCVGLQAGMRLDLAALSAAIWLVAVALVDRVALRRLAMPKFWTITAVFALGSGLLLGPRDIHLGGVSLSATGLEAGALMMTRGVFIFALVSWLSRAIDGAVLARLARRVGLGGLGVAVASAFSVLPALRDQILAGRARLRRGPGSPLARARTFVVEVLAETTRLAEQLAVEREGAPRAAFIVVEGAPGSGKSTAVESLAEALRQAGLSVGGVSQPALEPEGRRSGYDLLDLSSGQRRCFARRKAGGRGFEFEADAWAWAAERLGRAQRESDVVVVDELGLLESRGEGHLEALRALARKPGKAAALVAAVREGCLPPIAEALGAAVAILKAPADPAEITDVAASLKVRVDEARERSRAKG